MTNSPVQAERKSEVGKSESSWLSRNGLLAALGALFVAIGIVCAWNITDHTQKSTRAIEGILERYSMKNESSLAVDRYSKEHPVLGFFFASPVKHQMGLPSSGEASVELGPEVRALLKTVRAEASIAAWWSWSLLSLSSVYVVAVVALQRSFTTRPVLFALTMTSIFFFFIGILAPAMVIWTAPTIPMETGPISFVLQHEVRGIAAIIWDLLANGHFIIGGFLLLFSIVTPLTKASLTLFVTASKSQALNAKIGGWLHSIGKWSMADVFVAAILLALYALKFQEATKSIPCLGLYYFIGYCLLSMTTTELLCHSEAAGARRSFRRLGVSVIGGLCVAVFCFVSLSSLYTYEQYTENLKQTVKAPSSPTLLDNSHLVLPAHK